ncbi:MAG: rhodanese-like domain-containing protein [Gammaproteobacteria bacterium]|nr:rhodanese-like domain-containing protein [Gammaproteobacteria bacterium]
MSVFEEYLQKLEQSLPHISADELKQWQEDQLDFVLVDVRQAEEFAKGYIPGATNIPRPNLEASIETLLANPKQVIIVHCGNRGRSQLVCHSLRDMGLDCSVLLGGYQAWVELETDAAA